MAEDDQTPFLKEHKKALSTAVEKLGDPKATDDEVISSVFGVCTSVLGAGLGPGGAAVLGVAGKVFAKRVLSLRSKSKLCKEIAQLSAEEKQRQVLMPLFAEVLKEVRESSDLSQEQTEALEAVLEEVRAGQDLSFAIVKRLDDISERVAANAPLGHSLEDLQPLFHDATTKWWEDLPKNLRADGFDPLQLWTGPAINTSAAAEELLARKLHQLEIPSKDDFFAALLVRVRNLRLSAISDHLAKEQRFGADRAEIEPHLRALAQQLQNVCCQFPPLRDVGLHSKLDRIERALRPSSLSGRVEPQPGSSEIKRDRAVFGLILNIGEHHWDNVSRADIQQQVRRRGGQLMQENVVEASCMNERSQLSSDVWHKIGLRIETVVTSLSAKLRAALDSYEKVELHIAGRAYLPVWLYLGRRLGREQALIYVHNLRSGKWECIGPQSVIEASFGGKSRFETSRQRMRGVSNRAVLTVLCSSEYTRGEASIERLLGGCDYSEYEIRWPYSHNTSPLAMGDLRHLLFTHRPEALDFFTRQGSTDSLTVAFGGPSWGAFWLGMYLNENLFGGRLKFLFSERSGVYVNGLSYPLKPEPAGEPELEPVMSFARQGEVLRASSVDSPPLAETPRDRLESLYELMLDTHRTCDQVQWTLQQLSGGNRLLAEIADGHKQTVAKFVRSAISIINTKSHYQKPFFEVLCSENAGKRTEIESVSRRWGVELEWPHEDGCDLNGSSQRAAAGHVLEVFNDTVGNESRAGEAERSKQVDQETQARADTLTAGPSTDTDEEEQARREKLEVYLRNFFSHEAQLSLRHALALSLDVSVDGVPRAIAFGQPETVFKALSDADEALIREGTIEPKLPALIEKILPVLLFRVFGKPLQQQIAAARKLLLLRAGYVDSADAELAGAEDADAEFVELKKHHGLVATHRLGRPPPGGFDLTGARAADDTLCELLDRLDCEELGDADRQILSNALTQDLMNHPELADLISHAYPLGGARSAAKITQIVTEISENLFERKRAGKRSYYLLLEPRNSDSLWESVAQCFSAVFQQVLIARLADPQPGVREYAFVRPLRLIYQRRKDLAKKERN